MVLKMHQTVFTDIHHQNDAKACVSETVVPARTAMELIMSSLVKPQAKKCDCITDADCS